MNLSAVDLFLWVASFLGNGTLFAILIHRRRWREFPVFTALNGFEAAISLVIFLIYQRGLWHWYERVYWVYVLLDFALQFGVIWEVARIVMRPTGSWVQDAKKKFILWSAAGILLAAALPWLISPPAPSLLDRLELRANLFTSLVICELIAVVTRTSRDLGLGWRNHVMALGNGWTAWAVTAILIDGLHSYFGATLYFSQLEHVKMLVYLAALGYWMLQFWMEEPQRRPISPELSAYIEALHQKIKNNLDTIQAQR
jgi:hypothetical protein